MTSSEQERIEIIRLKFQQRQQCEKAAFDACLSLIDHYENSPEKLLQSVTIIISDIKRLEI